MMTVSSDSSDDEQTALLRESVDTTLFNDDMFKELSKKNSDKKPQLKEKPKSQRYLANEEQQVDVRVSANMQRQVGKKVSEIIQRKIKFVDVEDKYDPANHKIEGGIKLFNNSSDYLTPDLPDEVLLTKEKRKKIKKRTLEDETEFKEAKDDIKKIAVTGDQILNGFDTEHWTSRRKPKVFKYKKSENDRVLMSIDKE